MITAHQHARAMERFAAPDMLEMTWPLMLRGIFRNAPREIAIIDGPRARKVVRAHRGGPLTFGLPVVRHRRMNGGGCALVPRARKERSSNQRISRFPITKEYCVHDSP